MLEHFRESAIEVITEAQKQTRALKHNYIGTEHFLLGMLAVGEGTAFEALQSLGLDFATVQEDVVRIIGLGEVRQGGNLPYTPRAKKVLDLAWREAMSRGDDRVNTGHFLLGLVRENEGVASRILLDYGADAEKVRNTVLALMQQRRKELELSDSQAELQVVCGSIPGRRGCEGTGLYKGSAESDGSAVICLQCGGSGAVMFELNAYTGRVRRDDVTSVSRSRGDMFITGVGEHGSSMSYEEFLASIPEATLSS